MLVAGSLIIRVVGSFPMLPAFGNAFDRSELKKGSRSPRQSSGFKILGVLEGYRVKKAKSGIYILKKTRIVTEGCSMVP